LSALCSFVSVCRASARIDARVGEGQFDAPNAFQ